MSAETMLTNRGSLVELNDSEIREVFGGLMVGATFLGVSAVVIAGLTVYTLAESAGESIGKFAYNLTH